MCIDPMILGTLFPDLAVRTFENGLWRGPSEPVFGLLLQNQRRSRGLGFGHHGQNTTGCADQDRDNRIECHFGIDFKRDPRNFPHVRAGTPAVAARQEIYAV